MDNNNNIYTAFSELNSALETLKPTLLEAQSQVMSNLAKSLEPLKDSIVHSLIDPVNYLPTYVVIYSVNFRKLGRKLFYL